jgi:peptidoglycan/LPS O-acetylase OafA/YrhL
VSLATLSRPSIGLIFGYLFVLAGYGLSDLPDAHWTEYLHLPLLLRRMGICLLTLSLSAALLQVFSRGTAPKLGRATFLAYLIHMPLIGILWVVWGQFVGTEMDASYLAFYLFTPFLALLAGYALDSLLDAAPPTMQLALRGKVRTRGRPGPR